MTEHLKAACDFLKSVGCTDILAKDLPNNQFGKIKATLKDRTILARVQLKPEWGMSLDTNIGTNWSDQRYPYKSVQFILPSDTEGPSNYTHYILVASDLKRVFLCPTSVIADAPTAWMTIHDDGLPDNESVKTAVVENWTPKTIFYAFNGQWRKDPHNVWEKPTEVPSSADDFLSSLGGK